MRSLVRHYAQQVRNNLGVSNADKSSLGLTIVDQTRSVIPAPASNPMLNIVAATVGEHELRFADINTPDRRAMPFGVVGLQLFVAIEAQRVTDPAAASFYALVTHQPIAVKFDASQDGKRATYFGRWQNRKGDVGPWSNAVTFTIVA